VKIAEIIAQRTVHFSVSCILISGGKKNRLEKQAAK